MQATYVLKHNVYVQSTGTVVGPLEQQGRIGHLFDFAYNDIYCGEKNWEKAEMRLLQEAIRIAMEKGKLKDSDVNCVLAGDLINQNVITNYALRDFQIPLLGMYGACSTSMETLLTAALLVDSGHFQCAIAAASSHNKSAERQYRYPTEYGIKRPETATYTVTGAGACVISRVPSDIKITSVTIGKILDAKEKNPNDMGCAMAPAASDTILQHLRDLNIQPDYYDYIVTGDLSKYGSMVLVDIMKDEGYDISQIHDDCGKIIYFEKQNREINAGGSGCACCAVVTYSYLFDLLRKHQAKRILVVATGALLNPVMTLQKETIPCIAHAVAFERV